LADDLTQSFLAGRPYEKAFRPTGPDAGKAIRPEPPGLRITLTPDHGHKPAVGLAARTGVRGDFEITLAYEILKVDKPTGGTGAGVSLWITMVSHTKEAATIARLVKPGGETVFISHRASTPAGGPRQHHGGKPLATEVPSGKLRLVRSGATLTYLVAEGEGSFREIYQTALGTDDLDTVRLAADNGGSPTAVDVRLKGVSIRADGFGPARPLPRPSRWPLWIVVGVTVALLTAGAFWLWRRHRRGDRLFPFPLRKRSRAAPVE
jgi:hypothetical protein